MSRQSNLPRTGLSSAAYDFDDDYNKANSSNYYQNNEYNYD